MRRDSGRSGGPRAWARCRSLILSDPTRSPLASGRLDHAWGAVATLTAVV